MQPGSAHDRRDPGQRHAARNARGRRRERHAAGAAHRTRLAARRGRQHLQGPRAAGDARDAGGVRGHRPGPRGLPAALPATAEGEEALPPAQPRPILELVREGQDIVVQVVKDPIGSKGARLTTQLSIPSRYLVLLPQSRVVGVSSRIEDEAERARLKGLVAEFAGGGEQGYIVRTNAEGQPAEALAEDIAYLSRVGRWSKTSRGRRRSAPASTKT